MRAVLKELIRSREGKASVLLVLIYGLLLGYFVWNTFYGYVPRTYPVSWQASWIIYPDEKEVSQSFYRKKIYLDHNVRHAWIKVMAPDNFEICVNGKRIGKVDRPSDNVTDFFDLTPVLKPGVNVIAISNHRDTHPGNSKIVVEGIYVDWHGIVHRILSDESWKVNCFEELQFPGGPRWYEPAFNDVHWKYAEAIGLPGFKDNSKVAYNPLIYEEKLRGQWVWSASISNKMNFRYSINVPNKIVEAWVRIAAYQSYSLFVNGILVNSNYDLPSISRAGDASEITLDIYNITPFLDSDPNILTVTTNVDHVSRGILIDGFAIDTNGQKHWFSTPGSWEVARISARYGKDMQWEPVLSLSDLTPVQQSNLIKRIVDIQPPLRYQLVVFLKQTIFISLIAATILVFWIISSHLFANIKGVPLQTSLSTLGIAYLLPGTVLGFAILMGYDLHYDLSYPFQSKWIAVSIGLLLILNIVLLYGRKLQQGDPYNPSGKSLVENRVKNPISSALIRVKYSLLVIAIMIIGLFFRLYEIDYQALKTDEITSTLYTQAVLKKGYPSGTLSPHLPEKLLTTSEILPYLRVPTVKIFGPTEIGMRLPGVIFGTLTIGLLYLAGRIMFDSRIGLLAAAIYAGYPFSIEMTHYARYPSALEFFAFLTVFLFYKSLVSREKRVMFIYLNLIAFVFTYLCWEASGLLGPGLFAGILIMKGKDLTWLKEKHYWITGGIFALLVFFQLSYRYLVNQGRFILGTGMMDVSVQALWLQPGYNPWVFFKNFFLVGNNFLLSILLVVGLFFFLREKVFSYLLAILLIMGMLWTNILEAHAARHFYYLLPLLILLASCSLFKCLDLFLPGKHKQCSMTSKGISILTNTVVVAILLLSTNAYGLKLYNLPANYVASRAFLDRGIKGGIKEAVKNVNFSPGDKIISTFPHDVYFYIGKVDYYIQTELLVPIAVSMLDPIPVHRIAGSQVISNGDQLKEVLNNHHRVWLAIQYDRVAKQVLPGGRFYDPEIIRIVRENMRLIYEDWGIKLYLWEQ